MGSNCFSYSRFKTTVVIPLLIKQSGILHNVVRLIFVERSKAMAEY